MTGEAAATSSLTDGAAFSALRKKAVLESLSYETIPGWSRDDHAAAFAVFLKTCPAIVQSAAPVREGLVSPASLRDVCKAALELAANNGPEPIDAPTARAFFESRFRPFSVLPREGRGFLTGYYEPEFEGRLVASASYSAPLMAFPKTFPAAAEGPRYPERAAIEDGALGSHANAFVYLDPVDAFMAHVQGSVRVRLETGEVRRFAYAGRNGHPYSSVARHVSRETGLEPAELTAPKLVAWLKAHPEDARRLMRLNQSYIFFRHAEELLPNEGPLGAAAVQLVAGRSAAIDRTLLPYGLPVWIDAYLPDTVAGQEPWRRLMIAQDTGSAILGPSRADLFMGAGPDAGERAGIIRHAPERFIILLPESRP